jgi:hypothetical protein
MRKIKTQVLQVIQSLGRNLSDTDGTHGSYDPEFDRQVRKAAPHWFPKAPALSC